MDHVRPDPMATATQQSTHLRVVIEKRYALFGLAGIEAQAEDRTGVVHRLDLVGVLEDELLSAHEANPREGATPARRSPDCQAGHETGRRTRD